MDPRHIKTVSLAFRHSWCLFLSPVHVKDRALNPSGSDLLFPHILRSPVWRWESGLVPLLLLCLPDPSDGECPFSWSRNWLFSFSHSKYSDLHTLMLYFNTNMTWLAKKPLSGSLLLIGWMNFTTESLVMSVNYIYCKIHPHTPTGALWNHYMTSFLAFTP